MDGFLYKDLRQAKIYFLVLLICQAVVAVLQFFFAVIMGASDPALTVMTGSIFCLLMFMIVNMFNKTLCATDERRGWLYFAVSTPDGAKRQVKSKFTIRFLMDLTVLIFNFLIDTVCVGICGQESSYMVVAFTLFCFYLMIGAIELPFAFRYGTEKGGKVKVIALIVILGSILLYGLFGDISFLLGENPWEALKRLFKTGVMIWVLALLPYVSGIVFYFCYRISLKVYTKGVDSYEK